MCVMTTAFWMGHGSFAEECLVAARLDLFAIPYGLTDAERRVWIRNRTAWNRAVDRVSSRPVIGWPSSARPVDGIAAVHSASARRVSHRRG